MTDSDAIIPDVAQIIRDTAKKVSEKPIVYVKDDDWANLGNSPLWKQTVLPYLADRVTAWKEMREVKLDGEESVEEVGIRYLLCTAVAEELQSFVREVELRTKTFNEQVKKQSEKEVK